jgi:arylsulfatase A-like enzyme
MQRNMPLAIVLLLLSLGAGRQSPALVAGRSAAPNILLIVADDLGYGDLGSYGQKNIQTPVLDRLAAAGMRFTNFYAGSTVCAPSRSALMTGLHTGHTPIRGNREAQPMGQHPLDDKVPTVARALQQEGYRTGLVGKWGLGGPGSSGEPRRQGFDYFFGYLCQRHAHNYYPEFLFRNAERVALDNELPEPKRADGAGLATKKTQYSHDLLAREALDFVERNRDRPFFLALTLTIPHANNEAKDEGMEVPDHGIYASKDWPAPQKGHAAMITRMDADIGRLLDRLGTLGLARRTLVLFTSDNGPHREGGYDPESNDSNGPLRGIKRDLYEGGIRVPLIASWPGRIRPGAVTDHVAASWDLFPTFCELSGANIPPGLDGISLVPTLTGESTQKPHDFLYWEFFERGFQQAIRAGRWKGVRAGLSRPLELYDLEADPGETADLAGKEPQTVARLERLLGSARTDSPYWPVPAPAAQR